MDCDRQIMALLEEEDDEVEEEVVDGVIRSLERDIFFSADCNNAGKKLSAPGEEIGCYLQSDSAFSLTSSSVRVSDESVIGCRCGCEKIQSSEELGYLMEASDEELGILPPPFSTVCSSEEEEFDLDITETEWFEYGLNGEEKFPSYVDTDTDTDLAKLLG